jgi:hypothetical protein
MQAQTVESLRMADINKDKMSPEQIDFSVADKSAMYGGLADKVGDSKTGRFDFGKLRKGLSNDSMSTTADDCAESISFSVASSALSNTSSLGFGSSNLSDLRRMYGHQFSNCSLSSEFFCKSLKEIDEDREDNEEADAEPVESVSQPGPVKIDSHPEQGLPSVGSKDHGSGICKPCAWFWKPGSCQNGRECNHCHLCPEGEIKARKKKKLLGHEKSIAGLSEPAFVRNLEGVQEPLNTSQQGELLSAVKIPEQGQHQAQPSFDADDSFSGGVLLSVGAALHASGECRPCAWFHKPEGCLNGIACRHCHACPEGELQNRKKSGIATKSQEKEKSDQREGEEAAGNFRVPPPAFPPPGLPTPPPMLGMPSKGSEKHSSGECRPCVWYWKPNSCVNGKDCLHCHLCPETEIKRRKKAKLNRMRRSGDTQAAGEDGEDTSSDDAGEEEVGSALPKLQGQNGRATRDKSTTPSPPPCSSMLQDNPLIDDELPSSGSALHAAGKCKPCAWFWKPGSCSNGRECCHCHLCPEGELKGRRRRKESAMRVGALLPAKEKQLMHVLKIFPLL